MRAVYIEKYGPVEDVVGFGDVPLPAVGPGEVLIEVHAASVNPIDHLTAAGFMQSAAAPEQARILGNDVAGIVRRVGGSVTRFAAGDEVFARVVPGRGGTFAEFVAVDEHVVARKPASISYEQAASLPLVALTAWQALVEKAELKPGSRVLIHAGSGGVGSIAVQLTRHLGAHVVTTAGAASSARLKALGADEVIDYRNQRFEDGGGDFDVVFDTVGGDTQQRSYGVLKPGGVLVTILGAPQAQEQARRHGVRVESFFMRPDGDQLAAIARLVESGDVQPVIDRAYPLERTRDALLYSRSGRANGKIIIQVR